MITARTHLAVRQSRDRQDSRPTAREGDRNFAIGASTSSRRRRARRTLPLPFRSPRPTGPQPSCEASRWRALRRRTGSRSVTRCAARGRLCCCQGGPNNICDTIAADIAPLADSHTLVFHDYRGSGLSHSAPADTYRFERLADDLDELRQHLGFDSVSVLAHSMGGFVALHFALRHSDSCTRLALVGTTPCGASRPMAIPVLRALGPLRTAKAAALGLRFVALWSWRRPSRERSVAMWAPMSVTQEARPELRAKVAATIVSQLRTVAGPRDDPAGQRQRIAPDEGPRQTRPAGRPRRHRSSRPRALRIAVTQ